MGGNCFFHAVSLGQLELGEEKDIWELRFLAAHQLEVDAAINCPLYHRDNNGEGGQAETYELFVVQT